MHGSRLTQCAPLFNFLLALSLGYILLGLQLPPGFPVRFDVPVVPALSARVEFLGVAVAPPAPRPVAVPDGYTDATADLLKDSFFDKCGVLGDSAAASAASGASLDAGPAAAGGAGGGPP